MEIEPRNFNLLVAREMHLGLTFEDACALVNGTLLGQIAHLADALDYTVKMFENILNLYEH
jgi:hypothetical protein